MDDILRETFSRAIIAHLTDEDDATFWVAAFDTLLSDIDALFPAKSKKQEVFLQIGACSHWRRPHQTRWTAAGGFAWPDGYIQKYEDHKYNRPMGGGLPEFDWFVLVHWNREDLKWEMVEPRFYGKRRLVFRAALPTRTARHPQAAIHTIWIPGTPGEPDRQKVRRYGFRKRAQGWECVAATPEPPQPKIYSRRSAPTEFPPMPAA
jgi:hypothetical protein